MGEIADLRQIQVDARTLCAFVIVHLQRLSALEPAACRGIEIFIGRIHIGEFRVAAGRWQIHGIEHRRRVRKLRVAHVAVEPHFPVMGEAEGLAVHADVGDDHDLRRQIGDDVPHRLGRHARTPRLAELRREIDQLLRVRS